MTRAPAEPARYAAVVFDLFGTLVHVDAERLPAHVEEGRTIRSTVPVLLDVCGRHGLPVSVASLWGALRDVREELLTEAGPDVEIPSRLRFRRALERLGASEETAETIGVLASRAHMAAIAAAAFVPDAHWAVLDLVSRHARTGIVSNFDDSAAAYALLARLGLLDRVDTVVVSEAVGRRKPHPLPLCAALEALRVPADRTVYVGDSYRADVGVARAVGSDAAWIDLAGAGTPGPDRPEYVLTDLPELVPALGWAP
jgi:HAD superfamily hydrolase (TIGR01549 family)